MTTIAVTATITALTFGFAIMLLEAGYRFDLRRRNRRKDPNRVGGRRLEDRVPAAA